MSESLDRLQELLSGKYATWRVNPAVDHSDPTAAFVAELAQYVIALVAIQRGQGRI